MKNSTVFWTWFQRKMAKYLPNEKPNLKENEEKIMYLLKWGNGSKLSIQETIKLFQNIENNIQNLASKTKNEIISDLGAINKFDGSVPKIHLFQSLPKPVIQYGIDERVKEHVNDPKFDKPLSEIEIDYTELTFEKK